MRAPARMGCPDKCCRLQRPRAGFADCRSDGRAQFVGGERRGSREGIGKVVARIEGIKVGAEQWVSVFFERESGAGEVIGDSRGAMEGIGVEREPSDIIFICAAGACEINRRH
jgi:hypothetical protein